MNLIICGAAHWSVLSTSTTMEFFLLHGFDEMISSKPWSRKKEHKRRDDAQVPKSLMLEV
jgi:hypothetical protein